MSGSPPSLLQQTHRNLPTGRALQTLRMYIVVYFVRAAAARTKIKNKFVSERTQREARSFWRREGEVWLFSSDKARLDAFILKEIH